MNHTPISRITKTFAVLVTGIVLAGLVPAAAVAAPASPTSSEQTSVHKKKKVKLEAKADKSKVKVGEETKLKGRLDVVADDGRDAADALELIVVQKLVAGVWVDLSNGSCKPNGSFVLSLSFSVKASLTLRVYHPETTLYASATSSVFGVVVV
ncbi:hypothetical protein [Amycolatopsis alba]|uniref:Secreted protein n=1 Tax=Amycolatopsis alba DSM 44262 TaxID=1125972 RepID=A0A229RD21_AMYAL|nr:hypothetical protein [Amycolatopsis alba]OXM44389.1 hypothetical protein CFP75_34840 [Amycolatopsis alba DSM 44262]